MGHVWRTLLLILFSASIAQAESLPVNFYLPFGIATDTNNNLVVASFIDDPSHLGLSGIFRLIPATGFTSVVTTGLDTPTNIAVAPDGTIFVNDFLARHGGFNTIKSVNPLTGAQTTIVNGGIFPVGAGQLGGLMIAGDGSILTSDTYPINLTNGVQFYGRIVSTDPVSGNQSIVFSAPNLRLNGLAMESNGSLLVAVNQDGGVSQVLRVDPATGTSTVLSGGGSLDNLKGLAIDSSGNPFVLTFHDAEYPDKLSSVIKLDPVSGDQTVVSSGGLLTSPIGLTFDGSGNFFVDDLYATGSPFLGNNFGNGAIFRIDLSTGVQRVVVLGSRFTPNIPPVCTAAQAFPTVLGKPNHQFEPIVVMGVTDPDGDAVTITVTGVTQDEPVSAKGDGNTSPDAVIEAGAASVRAERSGNRNGRVYEISFKAEDGSGGVCTGAVTVGVPHSLKKGLTAIDDGQVYDSTVT